MTLSTCLSAQTGGDFTINKSSVNSGGGQSTGNGFILNDSIGQASVSDFSTGGGFRLSGGFWFQGIHPDVLFNNSFES